MLGVNHTAVGKPQGDGQLPCASDCEQLYSQVQATDGVQVAA